jgi:undecaprenyl-phosphate galactose phosphotransferase
MTIAAVAEATRYRPRSRTSNFWRRAVIAISLVSADLFSFAIADLLTHMLATPPSLALFRGTGPGRADSTFDLLFILAFIFVIARYVAGDYSRRQLFWDGARATTGALLICGIIYVSAVVMLEPGSLIVSVAVWLFLIAGLPTMRQVTRLGLGRMGFWYQPTAIIGTSPTALEVCPVLGRQLSLGLDVRWVVPESPEKHIPGPLAALTPIHVAPDRLVDTLLSIGCRQVILVPDDSLPMSQTDVIDQMVGADIGVSVVPSLRRLPLFGMSTSYFFGKDLLLLQVRNNLARLPQRLCKRMIDVLGSLSALILLAPVFALIAYSIKREDGGPVLFVQNRVGLDGRDFRCWKFRTMAVDAEAQMERWAKENPILLARYRESNFKLANDPRTTRVGAWLRRKSIDEFPQLFNVLLGEMSLVGPRPLLRRELPDYGPVIGLYTRVRPGITGLWQISGRSHTTFAERVSYDEWYIKNWTVWYDVVIMLQTVWVLGRGEGAY